MADEIRPAIEFVLPRTQARVFLYEYLENQEAREIKKLLLSQANVDLKDVKNPEVTGFNTAVTLDMQDLTLKKLIKEIYRADGTKVEDIDEFIKKLRSDDADALYSKVDEITTGSSLSADGKKK